jgi:hypothetical protein
MPVILATWEAEIRRIVVWGQLGQIVHEILSQKMGLVEWLKLKALSSGPSTEKKKKKKQKTHKKGLTEWID